MKDYLVKESKRILDRLTTADPASSEYLVCLQSLECFAGMADVIDDVLSVMEEANIIKVEFRPAVECNEDCATCDKCKDGEPEEKAVVEKEPEPVKVEPEPEPVEAEPARISYDLVTVRKALIEKRKQGLDTKQFLKQFGASNLTDLPAEKYADVMAALGGET